MFRTSALARDCVLLRCGAVCSYLDKCRHDMRIPCKNLVSSSSNADNSHRHSTRTSTSKARVLVVVCSPKSTYSTTTLNNNILNTHHSCVVTPLNLLFPGDDGSDIFLELDELFLVPLATNNNSSSKGRHQDISGRSQRNTYLGH